MNNFKKGDRIKALKYEFKDYKGTVIEQATESIVIVEFDNLYIKVATTVDNLVLLKECN